MLESLARRQTQVHRRHLGRQMMHTALSRSAHADLLEAEARDARCCKDLDRCADCQATLDEIRAARRDALIHSIARVRPRRTGRQGSVVSPVD